MWFRDPSVYKLMSVCSYDVDTTARHKNKSLKTRELVSMVDEKQNALFERRKNSPVIISMRKKPVSGTPPSSAMGASATSSKLDSSEASSNTTSVELRVSPSMYACSELYLGDGLCFRHS